MLCLGFNEARHVIFHPMRMLGDDHHHFRSVRMNGKCLLWIFINCLKTKVGGLVFTFLRSWFRGQCPCQRQLEGCSKSALCRIDLLVKLSWEHFDKHYQKFRRFHLIQSLTTSVFETMTIEWSIRPGKYSQRKKKKLKKRKIILFKRIIYTYTKPNQTNFQWDDCFSIIVDIKWNKSCIHVHFNIQTKRKKRREEQEEGEFFQRENVYFSFCSFVLIVCLVKSPSYLWFLFISFIFRCLFFDFSFFSIKSTCLGECTHHLWYTFIV